MKKFLFCLAGISLMSSALLAQPAAGGPPPVIMKKIAREIGLNPEQIRKVDELSIQAQREKLDIRNELEKAKLDLRQLMAAEKPDEKAIFAQIDKIGSIQAKLKKNRIGLMLKIRSLMTPQQWEKLELLQAERMMQERGGKGRHRGFDNDAPSVPPNTP